MPPRYVPLLVTAVAMTAAPTTAAPKRPMQVDDLFRLQRVADPQVSPDGKLVAYQVGTVDLDANKSSTALWLAATDGKSPPRQLTNAPGKSDTHPRWSPDGTKILFQSNRSGVSQLWVIALNGGEATQLTTISTDAESGTWSRDGKLIAFVSAVYPEFSALPFEASDAKNKLKNDEREKSPVKAKVFTKLFFRHWDSYIEDKRQHLFVCDADGKNCRDVTPGDRDAHPTSSTFGSSMDFTFTPDSRHLVFTAVPATGEAWSTNHDLCRVSVTNTSADWESLTKDNKAADGGPQFSPDGKTLAWRRQAKPGYEADKWVLTTAPVHPDGTLAGPPEPRTTHLTYGHEIRPDGVVIHPAGLDVSVNDYVWASNEELRFTADRDGTIRLFRTRGNPFVEPDAAGGSVTGVSIAAGITCVTVASMTRPSEVYTLREGQRVELSHANDAWFAGINATPPESVWVPVNGTNMQMWLLKPPGFDPAKKWPVVYLVHGGPQGAWEDGWSYRWNPQVWAAQGYVVAMPNPRGSTGFSQKFVDEISGDWGGQCYHDLVAGLDHVEKLPYVDKNRIAAAGGSFGGYMMNWFSVNDISPRFRCLITHCSVWNFESMWGTTEELWFDEYEHGGLPWEKPGKYREFSPHTRAGELAKHKTPMFIIHNDLDFRCPIGQGHELFTSLQRNGVPSRMINFPDEGHWVLKPKNSQYWHAEVFGWLVKYAPPGGK